MSTSFLSSIEEDSSPIIRVPSCNGDEEESSSTKKNNEQQLLLLLRRQLHRRNMMLDVLQQAYYRDVIVIKECLFRSQQQQQTNNNNALLLQQLQTIPSADIRAAAAFDLFAPTECELRCKPCTQCGGTLEIVHKECEIIEMFKQQLSESRARENSLQLKLKQIESQALLERTDFITQNTKTLEINKCMNQTIASLQQKQIENTDLVQRATHFEGTIISLSNTILEWKKRFLLKEKEEGAFQKEQMAKIQFQIKEKDDEIQTLEQQKDDQQFKVKSLQLLNEKNDNDIDKYIEEISSWSDKNEHLESQINEMNIHQNTDKEEMQQVQHLLGQSQRNEVLLQQKISRLECNQEETSNQAEIKYDNLRNVLATKQKEFSNEKALQKRHFLSEIRLINQQHVEEMTNKNAENFKMCKKAKQQQQELCTMMECIVTSAKMLGFGCIQQRALLKKERWYGEDVDNDTNVVIEEAKNVDSDYRNSFSLLPSSSSSTTEAIKRKTDEMKLLIVRNSTGSDFQSSTTSYEDNSFVSNIEWGELLTNKENRKEVFDFLELVSVKSMLSTVALVDHLHTQSEEMLRQMQSKFENEALEQSLAAKVISTELEESNELCRKREIEVFQLGEKLDATYSYCAMIEDKYEIGLTTIAANMEMELVQSTIDLNRLLKEQSVANERIYHLTEEIQIQTKGTEMHQAAFCDSEAGCRLLVQKLNEVHLKEVKRLQTNVAVDIQCVCCTKEVAIQVDLVTLPIYSNKNNTAIVNRNYEWATKMNNSDKNPAMMQQKYYAMPVPSSLGRNTICTSTPGEFLGVSNSLYHPQRRMT